MITTSRSASIKTFSETPETLTRKRSFQVVVESNGVKSVGEERELDDDEPFPCYFKTLTLPSVPDTPIASTPSSKDEDLVVHTGCEHEHDDKEEPPPYSPTSPKNDDPPFEYDFNLQVVDMGFPTVRVVKRPAVIDDTTLLLTCGDRIIFNGVTTRRFKIFGVAYPTGIFGHLTYSIHDLVHDCFLYMMVPKDWTVEGLLDMQHGSLRG
jgi:hypothetical protein